MIHVTVCVVGLNRSLSWTHDSISRSVLRPLADSPLVKLTVQLTLIDPRGPIDNPTSGEFGAIEPGLPQSWAGFPVRWVDQGVALEQSEELKGALLEFGDVWHDGGKSVSNALVFLFALNDAWSDVPPNSDVVIFLRPDIRIDGRLGISRRVWKVWILGKLGMRPVLAPSWGTFGGCNDRFSVMSAFSAERYFTRWRRVPDWIAQAKPFDSEKFLWFVLRDCHVSSSIYTPMRRIRIGGVVEAGDGGFFEQSEFARYIRDRIVKISGAVRNIFPARDSHAP